MVLAAMSTEEVGLIIIGGVVALILLGLMVFFPDVMFGRHKRSEKWDEFLHQPPDPPQE